MERLRIFFSQATQKAKEESQPGARGELLDEVCDDMDEPRFAFVGADNNYGGENPKFEQGPLAQVTPKITAAVRAMKGKKND